jgi:hypothetical protein
MGQRGMTRIKLPFVQAFADRHGQGRSGAKSRSKVKKAKPVASKFVSDMPSHAVSLCGVISERWAQ